VGVPEFFIVILVVFGIGIIGVLVFGGWAVVATLRLMGRILFGAGASRNPPPLLNGVRCANPGCRADNPGRARYCRRCGRGLHANEPAVVRRVAMW
jgi:hypothetical protein